MRLNLFFDNGCGDLVIKQSAAEKLAEIGRAFIVVPERIEISGVCDQKSFARVCMPFVCPFSMVQMLLLPD